MTNWYCPLPFKHIFVDSTGLSPCCNTVSEFGLDVDIEQYKSHPKVIKLQSQFLSGDVPEACGFCQKQERVQNKSMRLDALDDYNHEIFETTQFDFIHFSQSNLCNFKCRSCGPQDSHGIAQEYSKYPELIIPVNAKVVAVNQNNHQWIIDNLSSLKRLYLTGGEPTIMPEIRKIIEQVSSQPYPDSNIMITTN